MNTPLQRIRQGVIVLLVIVVIAVIGYHFLGGYPWIESLWLVVITITGVGYSERSQSPPLIQVWSVGVIVLGMFAAVYALGGFAQLLLEGEIDRVLGQRRMNRDIQQLRNHIVVCGFGRVGQVLAHDLRRQNQPLCVIDKDPGLADEARRHGLLTIEGDATEEETLAAARVDTARALFTGLPSDPDNVYITLTARNLNQHVFIIARAESASTEKKLKQAGANRVLMPAVVGGKQLYRMIMRPTTADLMELVTESTFLDLDLEEFTLPAGNPLIGKSVYQTEAHRRHRLLVVAVKHADGEMTFNPDASYCFLEQDVIIILGHSEDIARFSQEHSL